MRVCHIIIRINSLKEHRINGIDCSGKTAYEAEQKIAKTVENIP